MIQLVFAYCETRNVKNEIEIAFGLRDGLPWAHISKDMRNFSTRTANTSLVMGSKTFESFERRLPGRPHIVLSGSNNSKTKCGEYADHYMSIDQVIDYSKTHDISVIGGANVIREFHQYADRIIVSCINKRHYVFSTVQLPINFIRNIKMGFDLLETHYWHIDELTDLTETVYIKNGVLK